MPLFLNTLFEYRSDSHKPHKTAFNESIIFWKSIAEWWSKSSHRRTMQLYGLCQMLACGFLSSPSFLINMNLAALSAQLMPLFFYESIKFTVVWVLMAVSKCCE